MIPLCVHTNTKTEPELLRYMCWIACTVCLSITAIFWLLFMVTAVHLEAFYMKTDVAVLWYGRMFSPFGPAINIVVCILSGRMEDCKTTTYMFTVPWKAAIPLSGSASAVDFALIQTILLSRQKSEHYCVKEPLSKQSEVCSLTARQMLGYLVWHCEQDQIILTTHVSLQKKYFYCKLTWFVRICFFSTCKSIFWYWVSLGVICLCQTTKREFNTMKVTCELDSDKAKQYLHKVFIKSSVWNAYGVFEMWYLS